MAQDNNIKNINKTLAVIDTETNWQDQVMSIGVCIADEKYKIIKKLYYILTPEVNVGGMYESVIEYRDVEVTKKGVRQDILLHLKNILKEYQVEDLFAYNAKFDSKHLSELQEYTWHDIMCLAAYNQYNKKIPSNVKCFKTGRMCTGYGVEPIYRMLSGNQKYFEIHNALFDSIDELKIMEMLGYDKSVYPKLNNQ